MWQAITILLFTISNVLLAAIDNTQFGKNKFIKHGVNGAEYIAMCAVPYILWHNYWLIASLLFNRLLVFNIALSKLRRLKWYYISPQRKAITDRLAFLFFGYSGKLMYAVYLVLFILFTIKTYL